MRLRCINGFYLFEETKVGQIADFMFYSGLSLVPFKKYYTFKALENAPDYSISGVDLLGFEAIATFEGEAWDVFGANECVYDFRSGEVVARSSINQLVSINQAGNLYVASGLILAGSTHQGRIVSGFDGWFSRDRLKWLYSEVSFV